MGRCLPLMVSQSIALRWHLINRSVPAVVLEVCEHRWLPGGCSSVVRTLAAQTSHQLPAITVLYLSLHLFRLRQDAKLLCLIALPRPCPAFHRFQYRKAGRAWYLSHISITKIRKWQNFQSQLSPIHVLFSQLHTQHVYDSQPPLMISYLVSSLFLQFWTPRAHIQLNPFYHPFYPNVTHLRIDTRLSPGFPSPYRSQFSLA